VCERSEPRAKRDSNTINTSCDWRAVNEARQHHHTYTIVTSELRRDKNRNTNTPSILVTSSLRSRLASLTARFAHGSLGSRLASLTARFAHVLTSEFILAQCMAAARSCNNRLSSFSASLVFFSRSAMAAEACADSRAICFQFKKSASLSMTIPAT